MKISHEDIVKLFLREHCSKIHFQVLGSPTYDSSWMGIRQKGEKEIYWFGLVSDGSQAYDFDSFEEMYHAPVFEGKSLRELLPDVEILEVNACAPEELLPLYLK